jgi:hypothetical protein
MSRATGQDDAAGALRGIQQRTQAASGLGSDVVQRAERAWGEQRLAGAPQHADTAASGAGDEALQQRRLADARLAAD